MLMLLVVSGIVDGMLIRKGPIRLPLLAVQVVPLPLATHG